MLSPLGWQTDTTAHITKRYPSFSPGKFVAEYYIQQSHKVLQKAVRKFVDDVVYPDAQVCHIYGQGVFIADV